MRDRLRAGWGVGTVSSLQPYGRALKLLVTRGLRVNSFAQLGGLTVVAFRRLGAVPGLYTVLCVAVAVTLGPASVGRELLTAAPVFAAMTVLLRAFVTGHFVG